MAFRIPPYIFTLQLSDAGPVFFLSDSSESRVLQNLTKLLNQTQDDLFLLTNGTTQDVLGLRVRISLFCSRIASKSFSLFCARIFIHEVASIVLVHKVAAIVWVH